MYDYPAQVVDDILDEAGVNTGRVSVLGQEFVRRLKTSATTPGTDIGG